MTIRFRIYVDRLALSAAFALASQNMAAFEVIVTTPGIKVLDPDAQWIWDSRQAICYSQIRLNEKEQIRMNCHSGAFDLQPIIHAYLAGANRAKDH